MHEVNCSLSGFFLPNIVCEFFKKRAILSLPHRSGHRRAPKVASTVAEAHGQAGDTWWDRGGLHPPMHLSLLVTSWQVSHSQVYFTKHIAARAPGLPRLSLHQQPCPCSTQVVLWNQTRKTTCHIL